MNINFYKQITDIFVCVINVQFHFSVVIRSSNIPIDNLS